MPPQAIEQRSEFIEMVGLMVQTFGLRRISGRILGLLMFDGTVLSAHDMAEMLETSKGSVSTGLQELQAKSVIHKISHSVCGAVDPVRCTGAKICQRNPRNT